MRLLSYNDTQSLLKQYKIKSVGGFAAQKEDIEQAVSFANKLGYPVAIKLLSEDIIHKTDLGVVSIGIKSDEEAKKAIEKMIDRVDKANSEAKKEKSAKRIRVQNILVQTLCSGQEIIIGMKQDSQFGQVIMFGLGGIFVEVLKDVVFRIAPLNKAEALEMISELKSYNLLKGVRGQKAVNIEGIAELIVNISKLAVENPNILELDFNPVFVDNKKVLVADARIITEK